mgnify:CR=1 FL=1
MRDNILLLLAGIGAFLLSWAFFVYFQDDAFIILSLIAVVTLLARLVKNRFGHSSKKSDQ